MPTAATLGVAAIGAIQARSAAKKQEKSAEKAAQATAFRPVNIVTGLGEASFRQIAPGQFAAETQLSPEFQALQDQFLGISGAALEQAGTLDPTAAAQGFLETIRRVRGDTDAQSRARLENRLFQQGLLGSTTGGRQQAVLEGSIAREEDIRAIDAFQQAQGLIDTLINRGLVTGRQAQQFEGGLLEQLRLGGAFGGRQAQAAQFGAGALLRAEQSGAAGQALATQQITSGIGGILEQVLSRQTTAPTPITQTGPLQIVGLGGR